MCTLAAPLRVSLGREVTIGSAPAPSRWACLVQHPGWARLPAPALQTSPGSWAGTQPPADRILPPAPGQ